MEKPATQEEKLVPLEQYEPLSEDKLFFYSKSTDRKPGQGANEKGNPANYTELSKIKDWRRILSNFHVCPFKYKGYTYNSIEHVFQAMKIALVDKEAALRFTVESGNEIGQGDGAMAQKNRKLRMLSKPQQEKWASMNRQIMYEAAFEKYKACKEAREVLKATGKAQLWHIVIRSKYPDHFTHLELIRDKLNE